jgi:catechol 2,3-dioxygenase-like lactoylglutathione lyase family enzyme
MTLASADVIGFVGTTDGERARDFYERVLGLTFVSDERFALVFDANGVMIRIFKLDSLSPAPYTILGWGVADIAETIRSLSAKGVAFERYAGMPQDANGVWVSPTGAKVAWFKDPDGNVLSLTQFTLPS